MRWAWSVPRQHPELHAGANHVLLCLADRYNDREGRAWPSQHDIQARTNLSDSTVRRHLVELEQMGLICRTIQRENGRQVATFYTFPDVGRVAPPEAPEPVLDVGLEEWMLR